MRTVIVISTFGVILLCVWSGTIAQDEGDAAKPSRTVALDDIAWLAGRWQGAFSNGVKAEEHWSAPAGQSMMGMFRMMPGDKAAMYEFLVIEADDDGVALRFLHYGRNLKEMDEKPLHLKLVRATDREAVFENAEDGGRPGSISYRLDGTDLVCLVESTGDDGQPESFSVRFSKVTD